MDGFFYEDADFVESTTVGGFASAKKSRTFEDIFEEACENFKANWKTDFRTGFTKQDILGNKTAVASFKNDLLSTLHDDVANLEATFTEECGDIGTVGGLYDQVSQLFDNKIQDYFDESANVGDLLPIKTVDFPLLVKKNIKESFKDIVGQEVTNTLQVKKRIEHTIVYSRKNPEKKWEYPQCMYDPDFQALMNEGRGTPLSTDPQDLPIYQKNIVTTLTDETTDRNIRVVIDLQITAVVDDEDNVVQLPVPMRVNLADGAWVGGVINLKYKDSSGGDKEMHDVLSGFTDWDANTTTITSGNTGTDGVKKVIFSGRLSNENNENTLRTKYIREDRDWTIGEGCKIDASYTLEELQEHKALAQMDLYQRSYDDLVKLLHACADRDGYDWLDAEFEKYKDSGMNPLDWNPVIFDTEFDCATDVKTVALRSEYIAKELKFKLDRFVIDIADTLKIEDIHFVLWGNPRYISLLNPYVKWVFNAGNSLGGVKLDYNYGIMTSGDVKIYVVSSKLVDAKTHRGIRLIPMIPDTITFKRFKFSTDIVTSKESAYHDQERKGGSMTYVWGTERYLNCGLQEVQANVSFQNDDFIYFIK